MKFHLCALPLSLKAGVYFPRLALADDKEVGEQAHVDGENEPKGTHSDALLRKPSQRNVANDAELRIAQRKPERRRTHVVRHENSGVESE